MMTGIALQLSASAVALGLMGGAVGVHYFKVREGVSAHAEAELSDNIAYASYEQEPRQPLFETGGETMSLMSKASPGKTEKELYLESLQQILQKFEALNEENKSLRQTTIELQEQVEETNRDYSLLRFRVDTHSESFRPMRLKEESSYSKAVPAHSVLPPKNW